MTTSGQIVDLLVRAEAAALGGAPNDADAPLAELERVPDLPAEIDARRIWLAAVAGGARGRYGRALEMLEPVTSADVAGAPPELVLIRAAACATAASLLRQIGDHPAADPLDQAGLVLLGQVPAPLGADVRLDCAVGAAADAVGVSDLPTARARLELARGLVRPDVGWRPIVRFHWVETEVALLALDVPAALLGARAAVELAGDAGSPRHLAKSAMFLGVAQGLEGDLASAATDLRTAAELADRHQLLPLVWPVRAVLATMPGLVDDATERAKHLLAARAAVAAIATGLPPERRDRWIERDPMAAFLFADDSHEPGHGRQGS